jgi:hypothetical protein
MNVKEKGLWPVILICFEFTDSGLYTEVRAAVSHNITVKENCKDKQRVPEIGLELILPKQLMVLILFSNRPRGQTRCWKGYCPDREKVLLKAG